MLESKFSDELRQATIEEIEQMMRRIEQNKGVLTEDYIELR